MLDYPSMPTPTTTEDIDLSNHLIIQELSYDMDDLKRQSVSMLKMLNADQMEAFSGIMDALTTKVFGFFFIYGFGGTGKTFLWTVLASTLRSRGEIVLTVASSGIAPTLLPGGRTTHSIFAIPIQVTENSVCSIWQNSSLANLIESNFLNYMG